MRVAVVGVLLLFAIACDTPPAFPVPSGPAKVIGLDVFLPVYVLGTWTIDTFSESLRLELAKYNIRVVDRRPEPGVVAVIRLGRFTYRDWQEIDVELTHDGVTTPLGRIRTNDLSMDTIDVAAEPVAVLIARWLWASQSQEAGPRSVTGI